VDQRVWKKDWVIDCKPVGNGVAAFKYLAPYIFRVALSNRRILKLEAGNVTFQYKESATQQIKTATVSAEEFIRRFLQHVLPPRFVKVRYFGLLSPKHRHWLAQVRLLLAPLTTIPISQNSENCARVKQPLLCPRCGSQLILRGPLKPQRARPP